MVAGECERPIGRILYGRKKIFEERQLKNFAYDCLRFH